MSKSSADANKCAICLISNNNTSTITTNASENDVKPVFVHIWPNCEHNICLNCYDDLIKVKSNFAKCQICNKTHAIKQEWLLDDKDNLTYLTTTSDSAAAANSASIILNEPSDDTNPYHATTTTTLPNYTITNHYIGLDQRPTGITVVDSCTNSLQNVIEIEKPSFYYSQVIYESDVNFYCDVEYHSLVCNYGQVVHHPNTHELPPESINDNEPLSSFDCVTFKLPVNYYSAVRFFGLVSHHGKINFYGSVKYLSQVTGST